MDDDGKERGIFFIFLSAKAPDTFEFLKREWINSGNFLGLGAEEDPIAGRQAGTGMFYDSDETDSASYSEFGAIHCHTRRGVRFFAEPVRAALAGKLSR
jgi:hypothetical protein